MHPNEKLFNTFLLNTETSGDTLKASCPFCDVDTELQKLAVKLSTGQWRCSKCDESGNITSFFQKVHEAGSDDDGFLHTLSKDRGITTTTLKAWGYRRIHTGDLVVPQYSTKGAITNLCRIVCVKKVNLDSGSSTEKPIRWDCEKPIPQGCKPRMWSSPGSGERTNMFMNVSSLKKIKSVDTIYLTEGWDGPALDECRSYTKNLTSLVVAIPGAHTFSKKFLPIFNDKTVIVCTHNDHNKTRTNTITKKKTTTNAAEQCMAKVLATFAESDFPPREIKRLWWGDNQPINSKFPSGYDLRDLYNSNTAGTWDRGTAAKEVSQFVNRNTHTVPPGSYTQKVTSGTDHNGDSPEGTTPDKPMVDPIPCESFAALCKEYEHVLHITKTFRETLAIVMAIIVSTRIKGEQLWFRLIGPPGSGKTTIAEAISVSREHVNPISLTTGFHSGYKELKGKNRGKDASTIRFMNNKCTVWKDADTMLSSPKRDQINAQLRDIYDGNTRSRYLTFTGGDYENQRGTFLMCGTDDLRHSDNNDRGARFLDLEIFEKNQTDQYVRRATKSQFALIEDYLSQKDNLDDVQGADMHHLKQVTCGFMYHLTDNLKDFKMPKSSESAVIRIEALASFLAFVRARIAKTTDGKDVHYEPRKEVPTRIVKQFVKLAVCLCFVLQKDHIDKEVLDLVQKVAYNTGKSYTLDIAHIIGTAWHDEKLGLTRDQLLRRIKLSPTGMSNYLNDMIRLGMVSYDKKNNNSGVGGNESRHYRLTKDFYNTWLQATNRISKWKASLKTLRRSTTNGSNAKGKKPIKD